MATVAKRANNEWKQNFIVLNNIPGGLCSAMRQNFPAAFRTTFKPKKMQGPCVLKKASTYYGAKKDGALIA